LHFHTECRDARCRNQEAKLGAEQPIKKFLAVGRAKTEGGEGRTTPLNSTLFAVLTYHVKWITTSGFTH
jgi:hypothetical protein